MTEREIITFNLICTMNRRWRKTFLSMLKYMQNLGSNGMSRYVTIYADGDGDFRPEFKWDESFPADEEPIKDESGNRTYDAG